MDLVARYYVRVTHAGGDYAHAHLIVTWGAYLSDDSRRKVFGAHIAQLSIPTSQQD